MKKTAKIAILPISWHSEEILQNFMHEIMRDFKIN